VLLPWRSAASSAGPTHLVPRPLLLLANLFPPTPAIQAFLRLNQMGAELHRVAPLWTLLWVQAFVYGFRAW